MEKYVKILLVLGLVSCGVRQNVPSEVKRLFQRLDTENTEKVFQEWVRNHRVPWIEKNTITFLLWDEKATKILLECGLIEYKEKQVEMKRYKNTPLFFVSLPLKEVKVVDYSFIRFDEKTPNGKRITDPFHPYVAYTKPLMSRFILPGEKKGKLIITNIKPSNGLAARRIFIYLPWNYEETSNYYPVIYMQDGQNLWDSKLANFGGWKVDTTLDRLIAEEKIRPVIVVGIENSSARVEEYVGFSAYHGLKEAYDPNEQKRMVGYSQRYLDFIVNELIPFIKRNYRIIVEEMVVAGSSFGAGISLYLGFSRPDIFQGIGAFSFGNYSPEDKNRGIRRVLQVQPYLSEHIPPSDGKRKIYLDCGGKGIDAIFLEASRKLHRDLVKKGWKEGKDYLYVEDLMADHNEIAWAKRFEQFALFMWEIKKQ